MKEKKLDEMRVGQYGKYIEDWVSNLKGECRLRPVEISRLMALCMVEAVEKEIKEEYPLPQDTPIGATFPLTNGAFVNKGFHCVINDVFTKCRVFVVRTDNHYYLYVLKMGR